MTHKTLLSRVRRRATSTASLLIAKALPRRKALQYIYSGVSSIEQRGRSPNDASLACVEPIDIHVTPFLKRTYTARAPEGRWASEHRPLMDQGSSWLDRCEFQDLRAWRLENVILNVSNGVVFSEGRKLLLESVLKRWELEHYALRFNHYLPRTVKHRAGLFTTISSTFGHNYGHWFSESLARLYVLSKMRTDRPVILLAPSNLWGFQIESLGLCKPGNVTIEFEEADTWVKVDQLVLPSYVRNRANYYMPHEVVSFIRNRVFEGLGFVSRVKPTRCIYVSRRGIGRRQVINEQEVMACLERYGFQLCVPQELDFRRQVELFREARVVVGSAGSALTNTLFSQSADVIELKTSADDDLFYRRISEVVGNRHHCSPAVARDRAKQSGVIINVDALKGVVGRVLANRRA